MLMNPRILLFAIALILVAGGDSLAATYTAVKNGNWTDPTTWGAASAPGNSDIVNIGTYKVTVAAGSTYNGSSGSAINITNGGTLYVAGNWTVTGGSTNITVSGTGTIEVTGTLSIQNQTKITFTNGTIKAGTLSMPDYNSSSGITYTAGTIQVTSGNLYVGFSATFNYPSNMAIPGNVTLRNGSTLNITTMTGSIDIQKASTLNLVSGTYTPTSINMVDANSTLKLSSGSLTYGNAFTLNQTSLLVNGGTLTINNTLTVGGGSTFTVASGASANIGTNASQVNFTRDNSSGITFSNAGNMTIVGSARVYGTATNTGTLNVGVDYRQENVSGGMTSSGVFNVGRDAYAQGIIQLNPSGSSVMTVARDLYVNDNPWIVVGTSVGACNSSISQYANLIVKSNVNLTGSGDVVVNQNGRFVVFGNMTTNGTGNLVTINCGGQAYVHGNISLGTGGGNTVTNNNNAGSPTGSDGQPVIGLYVNGTTTAQNTSGTIGTKAQLQANDLPFFNYIAAIPDSPLPVKLQYFKVVDISEKGISLEWATSMEKNFSHFEVQRAGADLLFSTISIVQGRGGLEVKTVYALLDAAPANGKNYYRLKAIDLDNSFEYFNVIVADWNSDIEGVSLYPNPAVNYTFTLNIGDEYSQSVQLTVYESKGYAVYSASLEGPSTTVTLPEGIAPGIYFVRVSSAAKQQVIRLVVK